MGFMNDFIDKEAIKMEYFLDRISVIVTIIVNFRVFLIYIYWREL